MTLAEALEILGNVLPEFTELGVPEYQRDRFERTLIALATGEEITAEDKNACSALILFFMPHEQAVDWLAGEVAKQEIRSAFAEVEDYLRGDQT